MQENFDKYLQNKLITISENVKKFRENKNLSQEALAEIVDCSREFINRVENRKEDLSLKLLLRLAFELGIEPENFLKPID